MESPGKVTPVYRLTLRLEQGFMTSEPGYVCPMPDETLTVDVMIGRDKFDDREF